MLTPLPYNFDYKDMALPLFDLYKRQKQETIVTPSQRDRGKLGRQYEKNLQNMKGSC